MPAAKDKTDQVKLAGEGGVEWEFDLPLSETFLEQVRSGKLSPVDDASAKKLKDAHPEPQKAAYVRDEPEQPHASPVKVVPAE